MNKLARYASLEGKRIFVTGGGSGIGEAIVAAFVDQGAVVAFVDILEEESEALVERLRGSGPHAPVFRRCDITDIPALQATMAELAAELGDFDVIVNNAANDQRHQIEEVGVEYFDQRIAINQRPLFFTVQAALAGMKRRGGGSVINFSSMSWHAKNPDYPIYAATKAAAIGFTRCLARDLGKYNIRVNAVTPGWVMTQRQVDLWLDEAGEAEIRRAQCLPGKLMSEDIASMVLFLAADDSKMCTAQDFVVDAGWT